MVAVKVRAAVDPRRVTREGAASQVPYRAFWRARPSPVRSRPLSTLISVEGAAVKSPPVAIWRARTPVRSMPHQLA